MNSPGTWWRLAECKVCQGWRQGVYRTRCNVRKVLFLQKGGIQSLRQIGPYRVSVRWGFAEYVSVNERWAHKIPESISYEEGALMEPLAVAVHNVERSGVEGGEVAVVFGAGPVGNLISQVLKTMGASRVIAVDLVDWRLDLARKLGADVTINPRSKDVVEEVLKITDQTGADVSFEAVGDVGGLGTSDEGNAQRRNHGRDRRIRGTRCQIPHNGLGF